MELPKCSSIMAELIKANKKINKTSPKFHKCSPLRYYKTKGAKTLHFIVANVNVLFIINVVEFQVIKSNYSCLSKSGAIDAQTV